MRILLLSHAPVVHTQRWAQAFAERGHDVRLLTAESAPGAAFPGHVVVPRFPIAAMRYPSGRDSVRREWRSFRPDVTAAHFVPNYGFLAALAGCRPLFLAAWGSDLLVNASRSPFHRARALHAEPRGRRARGRSHARRRGGETWGASFQGLGAALGRRRGRARAAGIVGSAPREIA